MESLCHFDDLLTDSGCGITSDEDEEGQDISDICPVPVIQLPNGKLVLSVNRLRRYSSTLVGSNLVRRLSLA